jgi:hypothetical protein
MKRLMTSTCLAAAFAVGLAAQSTSTATSQDPPAGQRGGPRPVTATGCLRAGDTAGTYMLTDVQMQGGGRRGGDTTTTAGGGTTASTTGSTAGGTGSTATSGAGQGRGQMPTTLMLSPSADVDLKPHVGHKIEVTGTMMGGRGNGGGTTATGTTAGTTGGGTTTGTGTTTSTGTTTGTGTSAAGGGTQGGGRAMRNVTVTSVRMISESCS